MFEANKDAGGSISSPNGHAIINDHDFLYIDEDSRGDGDGDDGEPRPHSPSCLGRSGSSACRQLYHYFNINSSRLNHSQSADHSPYRSVCVGSNADASLMEQQQPHPHAPNAGAANGAGSNDSGACAFPVLSRDDIATLRSSFDLVKADASDIGEIGVQHIFKNVPEASERFCRNIAPSADGTHTNWEMMEQGFVFLSGLERCLLRLNRHDAFEMYVEALTIAHVAKYNISAQLMVRALREFETVLLTFLQQVMPNDLDKTISVWQRFFSLVCTIITATDKSYKSKPDKHILKGIVE